MTGAESLSLDTHPVADIRSLLSLLAGALQGLPAEGVERDLGSVAGEYFPLHLSQFATL
jgi:hypothetical protein